MNNYVFSSSFDLSHIVMEIAIYGNFSTLLLFIGIKIAQIGVSYKYCQNKCDLNLSFSNFSLVLYVVLWDFFV